MNPYLDAMRQRLAGKKPGQPPGGPVRNTRPMASSPLPGQAQQTLRGKAEEELRAINYTSLGR